MSRVFSNKGSIEIYHRAHSTTSRAIITRMRVEGRILSGVSASRAALCRGTGFSLPNNIALEQNSAHGLLKDTVDLADLSQLQGARSAGEQEADNDKDGVVENADGHVFGHQREHGGHDGGGQDHAAEERGDQELVTDTLLLRIESFILGHGVARKVGTQHNQDQRDGDISTGTDGIGDTVLDERALFEEQTLKGRDGGHQDGKKHGPERGVHELPDEVVELLANPLHELEERLDRSGGFLVQVAGTLGGRVSKTNKGGLCRRGGSRQETAGLFIVFQRWDAREGLHTALVAVKIDVDSNLSLRILGSGLLGKKIIIARNRQRDSGGMRNRRATGRVIVFRIDALAVALVFGLPIEAVDQNLDLGFLVLFIVISLSFFGDLLAVLGILVLGSQEDVIAPAPADELTKLLEDKKIQDASRTDLVVVISRNLVPVQALEGLRKREDERNGQRVGVAKDAHGGDKVGGASVESEHLRDENGYGPGHKGLDNENHGDDGEIGELLSIELGGELRED